MGIAAAELGPARGVHVDAVAAQAAPAEVPALAAPYQAAGATWWIETAKPEPEWWEGRTCLGAIARAQRDRQVPLVMNFGIIEVPDPGRAGHNRGHGVFALAAG